VTSTAREIRLAARPQGEPKPSDFELVEVPVPEPAEGQVLVRNLFMSVDPYMRGRMNDVKSYVPPFQLGAALDGGAVGEVVASTVDSHREGDLVLHGLGWRDYAVGPAKGFRVLERTQGVSPSAYLGVLGMPGLTAYAGLFDVAKYVDGETVFVSGAAGAVGSLVGQLVKAHGGTVVGSAGSTEKVAWLTDELGFDAAFSYKDAPVAQSLKQAAPDGIDVYFDNVGGEHLEAAIGSLKQHGRVAVCGMISQYNNAEPQPGPRNLALVVGKRLRLQGFLVSDHNHLLPQFQQEVGAMLADGRVKTAETVVDGLENAPDAFIGLLRGANTGKMVVRLASAGSADGAA
jgi:NADPH-dependent curcumin reductase CurA